MALCIPMMMALNERSLSYYRHPSVHEIRTMRQTRAKKVRHVDLTNRIQLVERLARSLSVEGILPISKNAGKTLSRTISLFENKSQHEQSNEFSFTGIPNESECLSIPEEDDKRHYSTKKPYPYPSNEHHLSSPPKGYKPICIQLLARHGSRSLNGHDYDLQTLKIWQLAKEKNMLTSLGEQLKADTELFMNENNRVGRGELTQLGKDEHFGLGTRLYYRLQSLFNSSNQISVMSSGKKRAMDSADEFLNALTKLESNLQISKEKPNKSLLYFHKSCTNYMNFKKNNLQVKTKINLITYCEQTKKYARQVLQRIYQNEFVNFLINEKPNNEIDIVLCLYSMFVVAPAQNHPRLTKMLAKYFNQEESNWFAYVNDAEEFYLKGPSIEGTTVTYEMAKPLLMDFFSSINSFIEGRTTTAAHLRFAHAETVIPFASLLRIPGLSDQAMHPSDLYTYENNPWRGDQIAPMAANIQWEIYQHENNSNQVLVRMLYNEMEVRFKEDCQPITPNSYFYDFNELKRAYAAQLFPSNADVN